MTDEEALKFAKEQTYIFGGTMKEFLQFVIDKLERPQGELIQSLTELCNKYCKNCPNTDVPNECTDCICTHIRGIIKGGAE